MLISRSGEIGKHAALKMLWAQALVGSSPTFGTNEEGGPCFYNGYGQIQSKNQRAF